MKADSCVSCADTGEMGLANGLTEPGEPHGKYGFVVTAGALIGLGVGLLADHVGSGVLVGVGVGLLASELIPLVGRPLEGEGLRQGSTNVSLLLIGAFLIFIGTGIVLAPAVIWPYAIPGFLILIGIWSLVGGFYKRS